MKIKIILLLVLFSFSCKSIYQYDDRREQVFFYHLGVVENFLSVGYIDKGEYLDNSIHFLEDLTKIKSDSYEGRDFFYEPSTQNLKEWKKWFRKNKENLFWDEAETKLKLKEELVFSKEIKVIKFMASISDYPRSISEKDFWGHPEEHAFIIIFNNDFLKSVKELTNENCSNFEEYNYAFIQNNDTIYSDFSLKTWIIKREGIEKEICLYDNQGVIAEELRTRYSFFNECW